jgi:hypothetical protein
MNDFAKYDIISGVTDVYLRPIREFEKVIFGITTIKILIVVDGGLSLTESANGFGIGRLIRLLRESQICCTRFQVDTARREASTAGAPTYSGFRFDQVAAGAPVLNKYDEVWCFGFNPGNNDGAPDSDITQPGALPLSDAELAALTTWMNTRGGGVLAMGDHDYLGASMCFRIPRVRSMRRWTNAQGVPPIGGQFNPDTALRHDTNQPFTAGQIAGTDSIPNSVERDSKPQKIEWFPWISQRVNVFQIRKRPHPILCHPEHGPIDVLPDHPHEGWCFENDEIDLTAPLDIPTLSGDEYPTVGGDQPRPLVIAHGNTTKNPPHQLVKGPSPGKRFAQISVYDGRPANVGRVVVDSTWHHWFDMNITQIEATGGENWDKISRYFLNVAVWLAPPKPIRYCFLFDVLASHFTYLGYQEYTRNAHVFDLGRALYSDLVKIWGPCWITSWIFDHIQIVDADFWAWLKDRLFWKEGIPFPGGDPCLSCPPFELVEIAVLGGLVRAGFPLVDDIRKQVSRNPDKALKLSPDKMVEQQLEGVKLGLAEFRKAVNESVKELKALGR